MIRKNLPLQRYTCHLPRYTSELNSSSSTWNLPCFCSIVWCQGPSVDAISHCPAVWYISSLFSFIMIIESDGWELTLLQQEYMMELQCLTARKKWKCKWLWIPFNSLSGHLGMNMKSETWIYWALHQSKCMCTSHSMSIPPHEV